MGAERIWEWKFWCCSFNGYVWREKRGKREKREGNYLEKSNERKRTDRFLSDLQLYPLPTDIYRLLIKYEPSSYPEIARIVFDLMGDEQFPKFIAPYLYFGKEEERSV